MTDFNNTNRGAIWKNDRKSKDTDADYTGSINVEGVDYWLNAWKRKPDASDKSPVLKFSVKPKEQQSNTAAQLEAGKKLHGGVDDSIPFNKIDGRLF